MTIIHKQTRLLWRLGLMALTLPPAMIGFAGVRYTSMQINGQRRDDIAQQQRLEKAADHAETRKAVLTAEAEAKAAEAEAYTQLGLRQATCGSTLSRFYFQPGVDVVEQLQTWGFDWNAPRYNSDRWYPLYDSNNLLFAAIRRGEIAQTDVTPMDAASICNFNQLTPED